MATQHSKTGPGKPVTSHPLFPAVVALWFGALFGFGSLAIRASLLERLVMTTRIDLIIPAAAPPLGMTARLLLALGLAAFGAMLGAWIGRQLGMVRPTKRERQRDARKFEAEPVRRHANTYAAPVVSDKTDEDTNRAAELPTLAGRRRALALNDESEMPELRDLVPLPGGAPQIFAVADVDIAPINAEPPESAAPEAPLDLQDFATTVPIEPASAAEPARQVFQPVPDAPIAAIEPAPAATSVFEAPATVPLFAARSAPTVAPVIPSAPVLQREPIAPDMPLTDLAERLAEAMRRRREARAPVQVAEPAIAAAQGEPVRAIPAAFRPIAPDAEEDGLVLPSLLPPRLDPAARAEVVAALAPATPFVPSVPLPMPAAMQAASLEAPDPDDEPLASLLPPRQLHVPPVAPISVAAVESDEDDGGDDALASTDDNRYTSLLAIAPRAEFVRIEVPAAPAGSFEPVVIFPGQGMMPQPAASVARPFDAPVAIAQSGAVPATPRTPDAEETERALKSALANLQRMSGAA